MEVKEKELLVNNQPVTIRGVNRHEHHPRLGKTMVRVVTTQRCASIEMVMIRLTGLNG